MTPEEEKLVQDHIDSIIVVDHSKLCSMQLAGFIPPERHKPDECWCHKEQLKKVLGTIPIPLETVKKGTVLHEIEETKIELNNLKAELKKKKGSRPPKKKTK